MTNTTIKTFPVAVAMAFLVPMTFSVSSAQADDHGHHGGPRASQVLQEAFDNRYGMDMTANIDLILRNTNG
ncbi:MAG: hypothetical protein VX546_14780, partial [Myxococcota bacterium]|nr:hypothetical protein [Myxococcota bacterium]